MGEIVNGFLFIKGISYEQNEVVLSTSTNNLNLAQETIWPH